MKYLCVILAIIAIGCVEERKTELPDTTDELVNSKYHKVDLIELIPATGYTYARAIKNGDTIWMAMSKADLTVGKAYYYEKAMEMTNFPSKELDRTFDKIYFVDVLLDNPSEPLPGELHTKAPAHMGVDAHAGAAVEIEQEEGVTSIEALFENPSNYADKKVTVKGKVTKINVGIMDRNWVHLQDGTGTKENFDLTVTTQEVPKVGDIVKFTGVIAVDKDFTMGYKYKLLLEDAVFPDTEM